MTQRRKFSAEYKRKALAAGMAPEASAGVFRQRVAPR